MKMYKSSNSTSSYLGNWFNMLVSMIMKLWWGKAVGPIKQHPNVVKPNEFQTTDPVLLKFNIIILKNMR